ncbi:MAG: redox-regulated ATPase YchF [Spirochaetales bacterium]|nr:redox-regulated ATPase YchF [Spirochaetales bacterium]
MALNCGIVGLPNVGKSTIFSALTSAPAEAANYPFCTIDPNIGMVAVPEPRLDRITSLIPTKKVIPAVIEFVDIAGLVKGASKGEGLGNKFLANIREVGIIAHVVRCFEDPDVTHVSGALDPVSDIETINTELALADLDTVDKRLERNQKLLRSPDKDTKKQAESMQSLLETLSEVLGEGRPARSIDLGDEQQKLVRDLHLITMKKVLYVCNVDEAAVNTDNGYVSKVREIAAAEDSEVVVISGKLEADISALDTKEEREEFLAEAGIEESGLSRLIRAAYKLLGMRTFFTAGADENRAWTFHEGARAPQAAGVIHTDFEKGFIKADVYHCDDLFAYGSEQKVKEAGKLRIEGKEYVVRDGDIMFFRFNV